LLELDFAAPSTPIKANRASWILHHGEIPEGMHVLHHCDNRLCVNPAHLYIGTNQDNINDRVNRNRGNHPVGEDNGKHKLKESEVIEIRALFASGMNMREISRIMATPYPATRDVCRGRTWKHLKHP
jgi:hypothetical protein